MRQPNEIAEDSFRTEDIGRSDFALHSLSLALKAYASTTRTLSPGRLDRVEKAPEPPKTASAKVKKKARTAQNEKDYNLGREYQDACLETVIHLQHFAELVVGDLLRRRHRLLADEPAEDKVFDQLLRNEEIKSDDEAKFFTIDASKALKRVIALLKEHRLHQGWSLIKESKAFLEVLTRLRNRMWHRGVAVLRYDALDDLVCGHALPFILAVTKRQPYRGLDHHWRPPKPHCGNRLLEELMAAGKEPPSKKRRSKIAFLKELTRASYANPLKRGLRGSRATFGGRRRRWMLLFKNEIRAERDLAETIAGETANVHREGIHDILRCLACGARSLIVQSSQDDSGVERTFAARCTCCSLAINDEYLNPSDHGWSKLADLWVTL